MITQVKCAQEIQSHQCVYFCPSPPESKQNFIVKDVTASFSGKSQFLTELLSIPGEMCVCVRQSVQACDTVRQDILSRAGKQRLHLPWRRSGCCCLRHQDNSRDHLSQSCSGNFLSVWSVWLDCVSPVIAHSPHWHLLALSDSGASVFIGTHAPHKIMSLIHSLGLCFRFGSASC